MGVTRGQDSAETADFLTPPEFSHQLVPSLSKKQALLLYIWMQQNLIEVHIAVILRLKYSMADAVHQQTQ